MKKIPLLQICLVLFALISLTLLASCADPPPETPETTESGASANGNADTTADPLTHDSVEVTSNDEVTSDSITTESDLLTDPDRMPYLIEGEYTVLSETSYPVVTRISMDGFSEQYLRVVVVDRAGYGIATYVDVIDKDYGLRLCSKLFGGYTMIHLRNGGKETGVGASLAVLQCAFSSYGTQTALTMSVKEYEVSDCLYDLAATFTGELDFRVYNAHKNAEFRADPSRLSAYTAMMKNTVFTYTEILSQDGGFLLTGDTLLSEASAVIPERPADADQLESTIDIALLENLYNDYLERIGSDS